MWSCTSRPTLPILSFFFFFNDTATTEIYTLSLHDALPISAAVSLLAYVLMLTMLNELGSLPLGFYRGFMLERRDRKSTRLNSSHVRISYAVFCLKKKKDAVQGYQQRTVNVEVSSIHDCAHV